jgi:DNA-binding LacI/PurR family transcriptional regulator
VSTASLAFSGAGPITAETRERVLAAAHELDYSGPNPLGRQLRSGRSGIIGVIFGDTPSRTFSDPVSIRVLDGLMQVFGERHLGLLLVPGLRAEPAGESVSVVDPLVESAAMDVAVLVWGTVPNDPVVAALQRRGVPIVVGEGQAIDGAPLVSVDDRAGAARAVSYLRGLGHTRIAEIALPVRRDEHSGPVDAARLACAESVPASHRLAGVRDVLEPVITWETPASLVEHGRNAAVEILEQWVPESERPTAIFAHSDLLAAGAVIGARELGLRIPEDVSIVGFDGIDLPWLSPDVLTSVHQPLRDKGVALGRAVLGVLAGDPPEKVTLPVQLVEGTTSAAPV